MKVTSRITITIKMKSGIKLNNGSNEINDD